MELEGITRNVLQEKLFEIIDSTYTEIIILSELDFTGIIIKNALIGLTPDIDFELFSNNGSGTMLKVDNGYEFDVNYGVITTSPENYKLKIYK